MAINSDEGEPGTFKDRYYLERDPHRFLEGALIAAGPSRPSEIYFYMRDEYPAVLAILRDEIAALEAAGIAKPGFIELRRGAGAYICGEESAMMESIEGKRGLPRHRPPYIAEVGLFGRPTLNHNVETLWWVRDIVEKGADMVRRATASTAAGRAVVVGLGPGEGPGRQAGAGRGHRPRADRAALRRHGAKATNSRRICQAAPRAVSCRRRWPTSPSISAASSPSTAAFVGSHAVVIFSDKDSAKAATINLLKFFSHESCGQCTPCREGTGKMVSLLQKEGAGRAGAARSGKVMRDSSICGLGQAAPNPVNHLLMHFREDN